MTARTKSNNSNLRYEWLSGLKKEELQTLCSNRDIDFELSTKSGLIKLFLSKSELKVYDKTFTADLLTLELKSKGIKLDNEKLNKSELIKLCNKNKKLKATNNTLSKLTMSELQKLCSKRGIKITNYSSKDSLCELLKSTNARNPKYNDKMTIKQLMAEIKGRGLSINGLKKENMIKILKSNINFEGEQLKSHINHQNVDKIVENTKQSLLDFINYIKENKEEIEKLTKKQIKNKRNNKDKTTKSRDYLLETEWDKIGDILRMATGEMIEIKSKIEKYGGNELTEKFNDVISDGDDEKEDEDDNFVYIVYDNDTKLIMAQKKKTVLNVFKNEDKAEKYKQRLLDEEDGDLQIGIQEIEIDDF